MKIVHELDSIFSTIQLDVSGAKNSWKQQHHQDTDTKFQSTRLIKTYTSLFS